ncbi:chemotaxis protein CheD [Natronospira proteinivora]|uniref:Probable chemoreceptor glutamine deamidase CheD n=1 Tax=Natronospira proteinivora TaxID=1807133 RepID=A0ABT1G584_9GAMM|nr:chemotaxis protein CheD [Natronospira proteinivora]MCP1726469.1 chemotaxis protein CheD [Natronospira proteinivora]
MQRVFGGSSDGFCSFDPLLDREITRIHAGGYCVVQGEAVLSTLLGSCVSVCLRDPKGPVTAMNHFLLPGEQARHSLGGAGNNGDYPVSRMLAMARPTPEGDCRYGIYAMSAMIDSMLLMGACMERLEAKIFGGAMMINASRDIGGVNVTFAEEKLHSLGVPILASDVGGKYHRVIRFFSESGRVLVSRGNESRTLGRYTAAVTNARGVQTDQRREH